MRVGGKKGVKKRDFTNKSKDQLVMRGLERVKTGGRDNLRRERSRYNPSVLVKIHSF